MTTWNLKKIAAITQTTSNTLTLSGLWKLFSFIEASIGRDDIEHADECVDAQEIVLSMMEQTRCTSLEGVTHKLLAWRSDTFGDDTSHASRSERVALSVIEDLEILAKLKNIQANDEDSTNLTP